MNMMFAAVFASCILLCTAIEPIFPFGCTATKLMACATTVPRFCRGGDAPQLNLTTCCPTCIPFINASSSCDSGCANHPPVCAPTAIPRYNETSCCRTCLPNPAGIGREGAPKNGVCGDEKLKKCIARTDPCDAGETPMMSETQCCPSCSPPVLQCTPASLIECNGIARQCVKDEAPININGSCCSSCIRPRPNCSAPCAPGHHCSPISNHSALCRLPGPVIHFLLNNGTDDLPSCSDMVELVQKFVSRWCYKTENVQCARTQSARCTSSVQDDIAGLILSNCTRAHNNQSAEVSIIIPTDSVGNRRRDASGSQTVVSAALSDPYATSGLSVTTDSSSGTGSSSNSALIGGLAGGLGGLALVALVALVLVRRSRSSRTGVSTPPHASLTRQTGVSTPPHSSLARQQDATVVNVRYL